MLNLKDHPTNLPFPLTSLIGRERELAQLEPLVLKSRLLTLTGPGGMGKTRLAAELGRRMIAEFVHGVWIVELAPIGDPTLVPKAVAQVLGLVEQPGRSVVDSLVDSLESREMLLILDNCEHMVAACADLVHTLLKPLLHRSAHPGDKPGADRDSRRDHLARTSTLRSSTSAQFAKSPSHRAVRSRTLVRCTSTDS